MIRFYKSSNSQSSVQKLNYKSIQQMIKTTDTSYDRSHRPPHIHHRPLPSLTLNCSANQLSQMQPQTLCEQVQLTSRVVMELLSFLCTCELFIIRALNSNCAVQLTHGIILSFFSWNFNANRTVVIWFLILTSNQNYA